MEHGARVNAASFLLLFALVGLLVDGVVCGRGVGSGLPVAYKTIKGHLQLLRQCRRQLTFIASVALGAFITRVINESPLTPLPLPPVKDPARWNFLTIPLHTADPFLGWMKQSYAKQPHSLQQYIEYGQPPNWRREERDDPVDNMAWIPTQRFRRHISRFVNFSPRLISKAVKKTLNSLGSAVIPEDASTKQWLMRLCF